jgi:hypothetical protein
MISNKIIVIENQNLTKHLVDRLDFKNNYHGFFIECWNLLPIINYKLFLKYKFINIKSKNKFINIFSVKQLLKMIFNIEKKNFYYLNNCGVNFTATIIDIILFFKGGKKILFLPCEYKLNISYHDRIKAIFNFSIIYFSKKIFYYILSQLIENFFKLITPRPNFFFVGNNFIFKKLKKKNVYKFSSPEFEKFLNTKSKKEKKYVVYIDQDMFKSYDEEINRNQKQILDVAEYEKNLFRTIKKIANHKILKKYTLIVAVHPRRKKKFTLKTKTVFDKTYEMISKAKVVLAHTSLAINYAVLLNKPIILLNAKNFFNAENLAYINFLRSQLQPLTIDISENYLMKINKIKKISFNKKKYKKFKDEFINFPIYQSKNRWEKVSEILKNLNK